MAEDIHFQGVSVRKRHPWGVWGLTLVTLGIYGIVWWFKINRELRDYSAAVGRPLDNNPHLAWLAVFPGGVVLVPPFFTAVYTARRIRAVQEMIAGRQIQEVDSWIAGILTAVWVLLLGILGWFIGPYFQGALNAMWDEARERSTTTPPSTPY